MHTKCDKPVSSYRYRVEMDAIMARWRRLGATLADNAQRIQELMAKLMQFEVSGSEGSQRGV